MRLVSFKVVVVPSNKYVISNHTSIRDIKLFTNKKTLPYIYINN